MNTTAPGLTMARTPGVWGRDDGGLRRCSAYLRSRRPENCDRAARLRAAPSLLPLYQQPSQLAGAKLASQLTDECFCTQRR